MPVKKIQVSSPKIGIEPPGLELDLGYSILDARPSVKLKLSLGAFSRKADADRFTIPIRKWWVRFHGWRHGRRGLVKATGSSRTAFEDEIVRERHLKASDLTTASEVELGEVRKAIEELTPPNFSSVHILERLRNQASAWLQLFKEDLIQARQNVDRAAAEHKQAETALNEFVKENRLAAKRPPARMTAWDRAASLAALVVIEGLLSLPPVAERQGGQLILSFLYPVSVSIANAIVGILVGMIGVHVIWHTQSMIARVLASIGVAFAFGIVGWMNLAVARWREGSDIPLTLTTLLPATALSVVLLVIGLGVFTFAVYKGVRDFSSGFPGHEEKWDEHARASAEYNWWKERYLFLVHVMRRTTTDNLDHVRQQLSAVRQVHEQRKVVANQAVIDLQTLETILPELHERINSSARVLLKVYRESAFLVNGAREAQVILIDTEFKWDVRAPDIQQVKRQAESLSQAVNGNLGELGRFEEQFEKEIAATINREIEAVATEARTVVT